MSAERGRSKCGETVISCAGWVRHSTPRLGGRHGGGQAFRVPVEEAGQGSAGRRDGEGHGRVNTGGLVNWETKES